MILDHSKTLSSKHNLRVISFSHCSSSYLHFSLFFLFCPFLFMYWHDCWAVLPELLNTVGHLYFFLYLNLRGIGELFSYLSFVICVCSCFCVICGVFFMCVLPVQHWQKKRPVNSPTSMSPITVSFILTTILLGEKRKRVQGWREGREGTGWGKGRRRRKRGGRWGWKKHLRKIRMNKV